MGQFRQNTGGTRGRWFAGALISFSAVVLLIVAGCLLHGILSVLCIPLSMLCFGAGIYFGKGWKRWVECLTVEEALRQDPRPPILYLRPFKADKVRFSSWTQRRLAIAKGLTFFAYILVVGWPIYLILGLYRLLTEASDANPLNARRPSAEQFLVSLLDPLGPVIAIGRPGERTPSVGAARMYLGDEWKDVVHDLLKRSQFILMFAGTTTHFGWELQEVFQNDPFVPIILILPFFRRYRQPEVDRFVNMLETASGLQLSKDLRKTRAAFFPKASEVIEIRDLNTPDERALDELNPFLAPIAQIMELSRPGWTDGYIELARENRGSNKRWMYGGAAALLLAISCSFWAYHWFHQKAQETENAEQFFADVFHNADPCTDPKLAKLIPDPVACFLNVLGDNASGMDICADPNFAQVFPDPDTCHSAARREYFQIFPAENK